MIKTDEMKEQIKELKKLLEEAGHSL